MKRVAFWLGLLFSAVIPPSNKPRLGGKRGGGEGQNFIGTLVGTNQASKSQLGKSHKVGERGEKESAKISPTNF